MMSRVWLDSWSMASVCRARTESGSSNSLMAASTDMVNAMPAASKMGMLTVGMTMAHTMTKADSTAMMMTATSRLRKP